MKERARQYLKEQEEGKLTDMEEMKKAKSLFQELDQKDRVEQLLTKDLQKAKPQS